MSTTVLAACSAHVLSLPKVPSARVLTDRDALVALFRSTDGAGWICKTSWDTEHDISQWHGVTVNNEGRVVKLDLGSNNLQGMFGSLVSA